MVNTDKVISKLREGNIDSIINGLAELGKIKDPSVLDEVIKFANDSSERVRTQVAICLGELGDINAGKTLLKLSLDEDDAVRMEAAQSLGILGSKGYREAKLPLEKLIGDKNYRVRKYAIKALGMCGDSETIQKLVEIFDKKETSIEIKEIIANSIGQIGGSYAISLLKGWVEEGSMEVRREAIHALGILGNQAAVDILIKVLDDKAEDKVIKNYAKQALKDIEQNARENYLALKKRIEKYL